MPDFTQRVNVEEWMDDLELSGPAFDKTLLQLARVNYWLGGHQIMVSGVRDLIRQQPALPDRPLEIVDLGCGAGDGLLKLAQWGQRTRQPLQLLGIDANAACVKYAQNKAASFSNVQFEQADCFSEAFLARRFDIIHCGLILHHFEDEVIMDLLPRLCQMARLGIVINDLQRHRLAFRLFQLACTVFRAAPMIKHDGLASIQRAFTAQELKQLLPVHKVYPYQLRWKWAFRYQVLIFTQDT